MKLTTAVATVAVAGLVVVGADYTSYAATGHSMILGHKNKANHVTTLKNTGPGAALSLRSRPGEPPLAVNNDSKVVNLNADLVDGQSASDLKTTRSLVYEATGTFNGGTTFSIQSPATADYLIDYSVFMSGTNGSSTTPTHGYCELFFPSNSHFGGIQTMTSEQDVLSYNGNAYWHANSGETLELICTEDAAGNWTAPSSIPVQIILTRLDGATVSSPAVSRPAHRGASAAAAGR
jgi:hypothetical protein